MEKVSISKLAYLGKRVLEIMEDYEDWSLDVLDDVNNVAKALGLAEYKDTEDGEALFAAVEGVRDLPRFYDPDWFIDGDSTALLFKGGHVHTFSDFREVGDPMHSDEELQEDEDLTEVMEPDEFMSVKVKLGDRWVTL